MVSTLSRQTEGAVWLPSRLIARALLGPRAGSLQRSSLVVQLARMVTRMSGSNQRASTFSIAYRRGQSDTPRQQSTRPEYSRPEGPATFLGGGSEPSALSGAAGMASSLSLSRCARHSRRRSSRSSGVSGAIAHGGQLGVPGACGTSLPLSACDPLRQEFQTSHRSSAISPTTQNRQELRLNSSGASKYDFLRRYTGPGLTS
jgi:hypothetical protein